MANSRAYGFTGISHLFNSRVNTAGIEVVYSAIEESAAEYNRQINAIMSSFAERTTRAQMQYRLPANYTLQPLDEHGNPLPVRLPDGYQVGFPIQSGGTAWGYGRVAAAMLTVEEANEHTVSAQIADANWLRKRMLAAVLDNTSWTFVDEIGPNGGAGLGSITIQPLANGDAVTYPGAGGALATDDHYLGQLASIADANNPFPTIYTELAEHPSNLPPYVAYIASDLKTDVEGLTAFAQVSDSDITFGSATSVATGDLDPGFGDEVLGKVDGVWIVEWSALPSGYIIAHSRGAGPVLGMREYPASELQGFYSERANRDGSHLEVRMIRHAGFGAMNRTAALAMEIGSASYSIPTGYTTPV